MWLWRAVVTTALLAVLVFANLIDSLRLLVGIVLATGLFVMADDLIRRSRGSSAR